MEVGGRRLGGGGGNKITIESGGQESGTFPGCALEALEWCGPISVLSTGAGHQSLKHYPIIFEASVFRA